ncbi:MULTISPECIES: gamma-glutamyltransferase family protein [Tatumella]|uniref:Gamma-glutamyltransferase family protein n=1 Tax=Tatumella punctata TaxID=399969 RepID=A0ABW1VTD0_9GAMM|nr:MULTISPECIES: gamma-glutamyltransferase family protein [unclassified Tatumella]MBS0857024.1 gamma-glutamyltransferase family protein [Tatumella sp. JGM16]MBS0878326.1 gamma-glutamyltransferase family protein [Tatumella sp. JGM82]MBS0891815.1 gamma-glutamyltransferase family protein [Tatumella sp. JGM94]MBS0903052.1 gamma-glutamyltransferase family protein [Tatumella sp. JGM100]MBS0913767.1 gamma-glutamyltransferase family protein [Tatumella sp. JGM91]
MIQSNIAPNGMAVTPHHLASESALAVLRAGGNAIEAMVAAAATIAVVYPHMNGLGGDSFWLIVPPEGDPIAIDASGAAGSQATPDFYAGMTAIPYRGPHAALTVAGTVSGWQEALAFSQESGFSPSPVAELLRDAIHYARHGIPVTESQSAASAGKLSELQHQPGFADIYLPQGRVPTPGSRFTQEALADTLQALAEDGLDSFYRGPLSEKIAAGMADLGMPVTLRDLQQHRAQRKKPLQLAHSEGTLYNLTPPTQGLVSLAIAGITDRLNMPEADETGSIHRIVEATKQAFRLRDRYLTDPREMRIDPQMLLEDSYLDQLAGGINLSHATPDTGCRAPGDTVWMGIIDNRGMAVSFIQSIYHEFGSGVVIPETGILWQNRGASFTLQPEQLLTLAPGKRPFHTLNPAAARLRDGRVMVYGSMGGDGQPQTQATVFTRYVQQKIPLQQAITAPRWLLGRTWGQTSESLKMEGRFSRETLQTLKQMGHDIEVIADFSEAVGHAGAIVRHCNGMLEGASDPRSNGSAAGF